ncbi:hypothetical protein ATANTOWER_028116 [Ataeniobius toweri]|uniref:Uncharacterized protein n=1 Tax=Ataeniobius toweri TaxID=208326 RepID=A0ABU7B2J0_9TELE|nr:hypothetical protein [Ataeniobius toweri]
MCFHCCRSTNNAHRISTDSATPQSAQCSKTIMPNEQPCLRENGPCAPSSKNANDKSSSTTMLVIRDTKHADDSNRRDSSCSSEKDSGYSGELLI